MNYQNSHTNDVIASQREYHHGKLVIKFKINAWNSYYFYKEEGDRLGTIIFHVIDPSEEPTGVDNRVFITGQDRHIQSVTWRGKTFYNGDGYKKIQPC